MLVITSTGCPAVPGGFFFFATSFPASGNGADEPPGEAKAEGGNPGRSAVVHQWLVTRGYSGLGLGVEGHFSAAYCAVYSFLSASSRDSWKRLKKTSMD